MVAHAFNTRTWKSKAGLIGFLAKTCLNIELIASVSAAVFDNCLKVSETKQKPGGKRESLHKISIVLVDRYYLKSGQGKEDTKIWEV